MCCSEYKPQRKILLGESIPTGIAWKVKVDPRKQDVNVQPYHI